MSETQIEIFEPARPDVIKYYDPLEDSIEKFRSYTGLSPYTKRRISKSISDARSTNAEDKYYASTGYTVFDVATPPYNFEELAIFYDTSPINHAAINAKVASIVGLGFNFVETRGALDRLQDESSDDARNKFERKVDRARVELEDWLDRTTNRDTFKEVLKKVAIDYEVFGNGYMEIGRTVAGDIGYIGHIPAQTMRVRNRRDGFIQIVGQHITFFRNFGERVASPLTNDPRPNEIIHLKKFSPRSSFYGVPDSVACSTAIVGDSLAAQYNVKFFDNSATPRYIVTLTGGRLSRSAEDKLFKFLQTNMRGNPHRTLFIPLPNDPQGNPILFKMEKVDADLADSSWENYRERNRQDILTAHLVPSHRVGGTNDDGNASSISADRMFKEQVVVPTQDVFESAVNLIIREKTNLVKFDLNELTLIDEVAKSQIHERYLRNQAMQINEVRKDIKLPAVPDGDRFFEPKPQQVAEQNAQASDSRTRDQQRVANNSDSSTTISGRNPKGSGSKE